MGKKILEDNEVLVSAATEPEVIEEPPVVEEPSVVEGEGEGEGEDESSQTSTLPPDESKVVVPVEPAIPTEPTIPDTSSIVSPTIPNIPSDGNNFDEAEQQRLRLLGYI